MAFIVFLLEEFDKVTVGENGGQSLFERSETFLDIDR